MRLTEDGGGATLQLDYLRQEAEQDHEQHAHKLPQGAKPDAWSRDCNLLRERMAAVRTHTHNPSPGQPHNSPPRRTRNHQGEPATDEGGLRVALHSFVRACVCVCVLSLILRVSVPSSVGQVRAAERGRVAEDVLYASILARMAEFDVRPTCGCAEGDLAWLHSPRAQVRGSVFGFSLL